MRSDIIKNLKNVDSLKQLDKLEIKTLKDAIIAKCYECCAFDINEAKACEIYSCPLWCFGPGRALNGRSRVEVVAEMKEELKKRREQEKQERERKRLEDKVNSILNYEED